MPMRKLFPPFVRYFPSILIVAALSLLTACDDDLSNGGTVQVQVTDAPSDFIQSADVWVSRVYLKCGRADDDEDERGEHHFDDDEHQKSDSASVRHMREDSLKAHDHDEDDDD